MQDPKKTIILLLKDNIVVKDDEVNDIAITVSGDWPDAEAVYPYVSVSEVLRPYRQLHLADTVMRLGVEAVYNIRVWVKDHVSTTSNYEGDTTRFLICEAIDDLIGFKRSPTDGIILSVGSWQPEDLPDEGIFRSRGVFGFSYEKTITAT